DFHVTGVQTCALPIWSLEWRRLGRAPPREPFFGLLEAPGFLDGLLDSGEHRCVPPGRPGGLGHEQLLSAERAFDEPPPRSKPGQPTPRHRAPRQIEPPDAYPVCLGENRRAHV